jgi:hypothetical protein
MSFRTAAALACAAAALLAPAAHADLTRVCARPYGSAVPGSLQHWTCVGGSTQQPGCKTVAVDDASGYPVAAVEVCGGPV